MTHQKNLDRSASPLITQAEIFIGWDVGGWDCDRNPRSRDALVVLDVGRQVVGRPWRGNLRLIINEASDAGEFLQKLLNLCEIDYEGTSRALLAVDAPLAFSRDFVALVSGGDVPETVYRNDWNPYLFRETERFLMAHGIRPLSSVKDMIGSQATKARHVVSRFAPRILETGVWTDDQRLFLIEAYPSAANKSDRFRSLRDAFLIAELRIGRLADE